MKNSSSAFPSGLESEDRILTAWVAELGLRAWLPERASGVRPAGGHDLETELRALLAMVEERRAEKSPAADAAERPDRVRLRLRQRLRAAILGLARQPGLGDPALLDALDALDRCIPPASVLEEGGEVLRHSCDCGGEIDAIVQRLPVAVWIYDLAGNLMSMNAEAATAMGTTFQEVQRLNVFRDVAPRGALLSPQGEPLRVEEFPVVRALNGETIHRQELELRSKGKQGIFLIDAAPLRDSEGRIHAAIAVMIEITEQKRLQAELSASVAEITSLVEGTPLLIWRCSPEGTFNYLNMAWLRFTGRSQAQAVGEGWAQSVHPDDRKRCLRTHHDAVRRRTPFEITYRLQRHDGVYRWLTDHGTPIHDETGRFLGFVGSCVDISERVELLAALEGEHERTKEASRRKTRVLTALSHDIRTPLNAVALSSEILCLKSADSDDREIRECSETIHHSVRNVIDLLDDLLDLNRIEAGESVPHPSVFALVPALEEVFAPAELEARTKGLEAVLDCASMAGVSLETDRAKLKQILANLLSNAVRYTRHGSIRLRASLERQHLRLTVEDTGIGIEEADLDRIFDEFIRLKEDPDEPRSGSGLGLAIARRLAQLLRGKIELKSVPGLGSRFTLVLPRALLRPAGPAAATVPDAIHPGAGLAHDKQTVLLVETDPASRRLLSQLLGWARLRVVSAANWGELLAAVERESPCAVLLDERVVPGSDLSRLRTIRHAPGTAPTPILLLADHPSADIERAIRSGAIEACITRPIPWEELNAALMRVLAKADAVAADRTAGPPETARSASDGP